jgi:hypothetical protein
MAVQSNDPDVVFYNLIHQLVGSPQNDEDSDRRQGMRQPFLVRQRIAPGYSGEMPPESAFVEVQCHDLTRRGFSFFLSSPPTFDRLVAAFGRVPAVIHVAAEVSHCADVFLHPSGFVEPRGDRAAHACYRGPDGQIARPVVLVGCRFVEKLGHFGRPAKAS